MKTENIIAIILMLVGSILIITGIVIQKNIDDYCNNAPLNEVDFQKCERYFKSK